MRGWCLFAGQRRLVMEAIVEAGSLPASQTGGKVLADRRLSRLIR